MLVGEFCYPTVDKARHAKVGINKVQIPKCSTSVTVLHLSIYYPDNFLTFTLIILKYMYFLLFTFSKQTCFCSCKDMYLASLHTATFPTLQDWF